MKRLVVRLMTSLVVMLVVGSATAGSLSISDDNKSSAIQKITKYEGVRDAAVTQRGADVYLTIIVDPRVSVPYARRLGDDFVRFVKISCNDKIPGKDIGPGVYNYLVSVYYENRKMLVMGVKAAASPRITWW